MLARDTVEMAYRLILGREAESDAAVESHRGHPDLASLRRTFLLSREFRALHRRMTAEADAEAPLGEVGQRHLLPPGEIETEAEGPAAARLWDRVAAAWAALGAEAPHWSVLTFDRYRPDRIAESAEEFALTGECEAMLVDAALARFPGLVAGRMHCLEIGCGVGRATRALARRFARVTGVDVSPAHLAVAADALAADGADHVALSRVEAIADYADLPRHDLMFTRLVLQHNPPPVQRAILERVLERLAPGGVALFQTVTHIEGYAYSLAADEAAGTTGMEMHAFPQAEIFALLARAGLALVEVQEDFAAGDRDSHRSHLFLAEKRTGAARRESASPG